VLPHFPNSPRISHAASHGSAEAPVMVRTLCVVLPPALRIPGPSSCELGWIDRLRPSQSRN
jgi:hypothetical protein